MAARIHKTSQADADLSEAIEYLVERNPRVALKFISDFEDLARRLIRFPELYPFQRRSALPEWRRVRMAVLRRFQYLVFYTYENDLVVIRRVVHGAREAL